MFSMREISCNAATPLKGRKRFLADINEIKQKELQSVDVQGLLCIKHLEHGEDEGSLWCEITHTGEHLITLNLIVSDTADYPADHHFLCFARDEDVDPRMLKVLELASNARRACTIADILEGLLASLSKVLTSVVTENYVSSDEGDNASDSYDDDPYDDYFGLNATGSKGVDSDMQILQSDFREIETRGFRASLFRFSSETFICSVSIPLNTLTQFIPPRALMAWDPKLLSKPQYLTLLMSGPRELYPMPLGDGIFWKADQVKFRVGLTPRYRPEKGNILGLLSSFRISPQEPDPTTEERDCNNDSGAHEDSEDVDSLDESLAEAEMQDETIEKEAFHFSLSTSLECLLEDRLLQVVQARLNHELGWAGAELLVSEAQRLQVKREDVVEDGDQALELLRADQDEVQLSTTYHLPFDPLAEREKLDHLNFPLVAFCYLLRRATLCSRFCLICYRKLQTEYVALKPYVCNDKLCTFKYYSLNRGPSLEYEILTKPDVVDLLVSLTYIAAACNSLGDSLPTYMDLRVHKPTQSSVMCDFDKLTKNEMHLAIVSLIDSLPPIADMVKYLETQKWDGTSNVRLQDMDPQVSPAAWLLLRWCIASCTADLEELVCETDRVQNIDSTYRQFRFSVGAPDAEAKFQKAQLQASAKDMNAAKFPSLYAFHGSGAQNWHSIIRNGLWYKSVTNGRAYGNGVYLAQEGKTSMGYAAPSVSQWQNSAIRASRCMALAEIINLPSEFTSKTPHYVVQHTDWIICRYLLVESHAAASVASGQSAQATLGQDGDIPFVAMDPTRPSTISGKQLLIPDPSYKLRKRLDALASESLDESYDEEDSALIFGEIVASPCQPLQTIALETEDDWVHDGEWVKSAVEHMLPAPTEATPEATATVQRKLMDMLQEQEKAEESKKLKDLGWYMPPDFIGDNLFQWVVEVHSFEKDLPIAQDMEQHGINSVILEIRFPPTYPYAPPFFRVLRPRFLPFLQGGGGHVTAGGSICMDLLTNSGWSPIYNIPAILLQIRLAISNLDPRPARLAPNWKSPYNMHEALEGYKRAATQHGWKVPQGLDALVR